MYLKFIDIDNIKSHFEQSDERMRFRYRRKTDDTFKWVVMEIMKSSEYRSDNQIVILYIQDVHDAYVKELEHNKELLSYFHHVHRDDGSIACYRFNFCYEQNDKTKIVLAIKDISDIVEWAHTK